MIPIDVVLFHVNVKFIDFYEKIKDKIEYFSILSTFKQFIEFLPCNFLPGIGLNGQRLRGFEIIT